MKVKPGRRPAQEYRRRTTVGKQYFSARWSRLRMQVLARDRGLCRSCEAKGITQLGNQIDHIKPAEENPELFWNPDNLQTLCLKCHGEKTRRGE